MQCSQSAVVSSVRLVHEAMRLSDYVLRGDFAEPGRVFIGGSAPIRLLIKPLAETPFATGQREVVTIDPGYIDPRFGTEPVRLATARFRKTDRIAERPAGVGKND